MLATVHPTLNDHEYNMRPTCVVHAVWCHFVPEPSTSFSLWSVLWLRHQFVTYVTAWQITPNPSCSKNRKLKRKQEKKNKIKRENKIKSTINNLDKNHIEEIKKIWWSLCYYMRCWLIRYEWKARHSINELQEEVNPRTYLNYYNYEVNII